MQDVKRRTTCWKDRVRTYMQQRMKLVAQPLPLHGLPAHAPVGEALPTRLTEAAVGWQAALERDACNAMVFIEGNPIQA